MQMRQRSLQRCAAQAQVHPAPWCASAGGHCRALPYRRATCFFRAEAPKAKNFLQGAPMTESGLEKAAEAPPPHTCLPVWLYLRSQSPGSIWVRVA